MTIGMGLARFGSMLCAALVLAACDAAFPGPTASVPPGAGSQTIAGQGPKGQSQVRLGSLGGGASAGQRAPTVEATATGAELAYVTGILRDLQQRSFAANSEFCGYIGLDAGGNLTSTPIMQGDEASCGLPQIPYGMALLASFHTHGTYSPQYASEFPTTTDMLTDASDGIDGYISTPGGRLWHVDTDTMTARQICGRGCLPQDPGYVAADDGPVRPILTLQDLQRWEAS